MALLIDPTNIVTRRQTQSLEVASVNQGAGNYFKLPRQNNQLFYRNCHGTAN